jgi:hypothetical protein
VKRSAETALNLVGKFSKTAKGLKGYPRCRRRFAWTRAARAAAPADWGEFCFRKGLR